MHFSLLILLLFSCQVVCCVPPAAHQSTCVALVEREWVFSILASFQRPRDISHFQKARLPTLLHRASIWDSRECTYARIFVPFILPPGSDAGLRRLRQSQTHYKTSERKLMHQKHPQRRAKSDQDQLNALFGVLSTTFPIFIIRTDPHLHYSSGIIYSSFS